MSDHIDDNQKNKINTAEFLTDPEQVESGVSYISPNIEAKLPAPKRLECRKIVREIKDFGISQRQMLYIIYLLALELEDADTMQALVKAVGENREKFPVSKLIVPKDD
jgi:hypothetical protein